jgi:hypothetical protein
LSLGCLATAQINRGATLHEEARPRYMLVHEARDDDVRGDIVDHPKLSDTVECSFAPKVRRGKTRGHV